MKAFRSCVSDTLVCLGAILRGTLADVEADFFIWQSRGRGEQGLEFPPDDAEGVVVLEEFWHLSGRAFSGFPSVRRGVRVA